MLATFPVSHGAPTVIVIQVHIVVTTCTYYCPTIYEPLSGPLGFIRWVYPSHTILFICDRPSESFSTMPLVLDYLDSTCFCVFSPHSGVSFLSLTVIIITLYYVWNYWLISQLDLSHLKRWKGIMFIFSSFWYVKSISSRRIRISNGKRLLGRHFLLWDDLAWNRGFFAFASKVSHHFLLEKKNLFPSIAPAMIAITIALQGINFIYHTLMMFQWRNLKIKTAGYSFGWESLLSLSKIIRQWNGQTIVWQRIDLFLRGNFCVMIHVQLVMQSERIMGPKWPPFSVMAVLLVE